DDVEVGRPARRARLGRALGARGQPAADDGRPHGGRPSRARSDASPGAASCYGDTDVAYGRGAQARAGQSRDSDSRARFRRLGGQRNGVMNERSKEVVDALGLEGARRRRRWVPIAIALVLVAAVAVGVYMRSHRSTATQYVTEAVRRGPLVVTVTATGT